MALLWSTSEAWMTPVTRNAAIRPLQATQLSNEPTTTTTLQSNEDDTLFTTLQNNPDTLKQMLQHVQSPQVCLEEMTLDIVGHSSSSTWIPLVGCIGCLLCCPPCVEQDAQ